MPWTDIEDNETDTETSDGTQNQNDDPDEGGDDEGKKTQATSGPNYDSQLREIKSQLQALTSLASASGSTSAQTQASKLDERVKALVKDGYKPDQIAVLVQLIQAQTQDVTAKIEQDRLTEGRQQFFLRCQDNLNTQIDDFIAKNPEAAWARAELYKRTTAAIDHDPDFASELQAFKSGNVPNFKNAFRKISQTYLKESGIKSGDKGSKKVDTIDSKNSGSKTSPAVGKDGKVDLSKMSDLEREIYQTTFDSLSGRNSGDPALRKRAQEIAMNAVRRIAPALKK